ncbi:MAG: tRNA lysidine(34) synthetase TilS, partial [bacterium]
MEAWLAPHFHQLFTSAGPATCVVGISGGPDSVALILLLNNILPQLRLVAAHMNHHARQGADADQNFVAGLAQELGVAIEIGHFHAMRKSHFEADARKARHQWLEDVALKHQAGWVATAHTLDDQAETLLMRLARGTGPTGLAGIRPVRRLKKSGVKLVRPLLGVTKSSILQYLAETGQQHCIDPTNTDAEQQDRAWVRHVLYPLMAERLNPQLNHSLAQVAGLMAEEEDGLERLVRATFASLAQVSFDKDVVIIDRQQFSTTGEAWMRRRWLRLLWQDLGWPMGPMGLADWQGLEEWMSFADKPLHRKISSDIDAVIDGERIVLRLGSQAISKTVSDDDKTLQNRNLCVEWPWHGRVNLGNEGEFLEAVAMAQTLGLDELKRLDPKEFAV